MIRRYLCLVAGLFAPALAAFAQPADVPGDEVKPVKLQYEEAAGKPGRWAEVEFTTGEDPARYYVRGTDVSAPFSVQVIAADTKRPLQVTLHRQSWGRAEETGSTGSKGLYAFEGRAYGDVGVQLVSSSGTPAKGTVIFWQGAPAAPSMAKIYAPPEASAAQAEAGSAPAGTSAASGKSGGGTSFILYVIAGLLTAIAALLAFVVLRRGGGKTAAALVLTGALGMLALPPAPAHAQIVPNPFDPPPEAAPDPGDIFDGEGVTGEATKDEMAPKPEDKDKDATAGNDTSGDKDKDATAGDGREPSDAPKPDEDGATTDDGYQDRLNQAERQINDLNRQASANRAEIERLRMLIESDKDNEPDPSNMPPLPLSCRPPSVDEESGGETAKNAWKNYEDCRSCYDQPLKDLDETLLLYEKLRIIYNSTKNYVDTAITIGDSIEKPHYLVEAAWAQQKAEIQHTFKGTKDAYEAKWAEFNDRLSRNLDAVGQCESKYNNNPMWRETDARLFYQTVKASYQRAE